MKTGLEPLAAMESLEMPVIEGAQEEVPFFYTGVLLLSAMHLLRHCQRRSP